VDVLPVCGALEEDWLLCSDDDWQHLVSLQSSNSRWKISLKITETAGSWPKGLKRSDRSDIDNISESSDSSCPVEIVVVTVECAVARDPLLGIQSKEVPLAGTFVPSETRPSDVFSSVADGSEPKPDGGSRTFESNAT